MAFELSTFAYHAVDQYRLAYHNRDLLRWEKKVCRAHPEWAPLTAAELAEIRPRDRWGCKLFKNMAGTTENTRCFITEAPFRTLILPMLNPLNHRSNSDGFGTLFSDKNYSELFMPGMTFPKTLLYRIHGEYYDAKRRHIPAAAALDQLRGHDRLVFKHSTDTGHGTGVVPVQAEDFAAQLDYSQNYLVQELIRQHESLAYFNPSSVNAIRINTLFWRGHVYVLGGILRIGAPGAFCDHESIGKNAYLSIALAEDGTILPHAVDVDNYYAYDTCRGIPIQGRIPAYEEMKRSAAAAHENYPGYGLIAWDFTVGEDGRPICVEFNTVYPGPVGTQCALGPVFAQKSVEGVPLFDELMAAVKKK